MTELARTAGAFSAVVFVVAIVLFAIGPRGAKLTEIQLGTDPGAVKELIDQPNVRADVRRAIKLDYAFIVAYVAAFVALALVMVGRGGGWTVVGAVAVAAAVATAGLDVVENLRTTNVLGYGGGGDLSQGTLDALRHASLVKWGMSATTVALLAGVFMVCGWPVGVAVVLLAIAAIGFASLYWDILIIAFLGGVLLVSAVAAVILFFWPGSLLDRY